MPSLITSIIGGVQGASASHHAADYMQQGYKQAGDTVTQAVQEVNPEILKSAAEAGQGVTTAAGAAGTGATTAADKLTTMLDPYMTAGATAAGQLGDAAKPFTASMMAQYSPAYQFQLQQGEQAAKRAAAAAGVTGSGGTMRSMDRYAQDYAGTAFKNANDIYNQGFQRLATIANMGQGAATTAGTTGVQAAEYAGNAGLQGAEFAGNANINARNLASSNTMSGAGYLANTQIGSQQARASGDLGAASAWNGMLGGIGQVADTVALGGLGANGGWSLGNIPKNVWGKGK